MKVGELIKELQKLADQNSDNFEVRVNSTLYYLDIHQITGVREYNDKIEIIINK
jgi:hypothetical protein